jgi:signal transduction histidine kinase
MLDITERRRSEEKVSEYAEVLRRKNEELAGALAAAREATEMKGRFLANMSHEIRTPLNGVLGMTNLLLATRLDQEQQEYAETVGNCAESLLTLINDILDLSKIEAGRLEVERIPLNLESIVNEVKTLLGVRALAKRLQMSCRLQPQIPTELSGDPGRLRQVLLNLVGNAIKFTERGRVEFSVERVGETADTATIRFTVCDTGIGMSPEQCSRLISKQLVGLMGGEIGVESELGCGSTFWFVLTLAKRPRQRSTETGPCTARESVRR